MALDHAKKGDCVLIGTERGMNVFRGAIHSNPF